MRLAQLRFSCRYGYLRCHVVRGLRVLSGLALATPLQPPVPSEGGSVTPGSRTCLHGGLRNLNRIPIRFPPRVSVRPRLTLIRLALFRNPWAFGARVSLARCRFVVTHAYIFFSRRSSIPPGTPSPPASMLPYRLTLVNPRSSGPCLMPVHHPRVTARLVSCYALFK